MLEASSSHLSSQVPTGRKGLRVKGPSATSTWPRVRNDMFVHMWHLVPKPVYRREMGRGEWDSSRDSLKEISYSPQRSCQSRVICRAWRPAATAQKDSKYLASTLLMRTYMYLVVVVHHPFSHSHTRKVILPAWPSYQYSV